MKIVVIGGSGLIGKKLIPLLRGHEAGSASPSSGVNTLTGGGLSEVLEKVRKTVAEIVSPPAELILFCGMSIGSEDETVPYIRTGRAPLDETVTFVQG
jgi:hypothetical protein